MEPPLLIRFAIMAETGPRILRAFEDFRGHLHGPQYSWMSIAEDLQTVVFLCVKTHSRMKYAAATHMKKNCETEGCQMVIRAAWHS